MSSRKSKRVKDMMEVPDYTPEETPEVQPEELIPPPLILHNDESK